MTNKIITKHITGNRSIHTHTQSTQRSHVQYHASIPHAHLGPQCFIETLLRFQAYLITGASRLLSVGTIIGDMNFFVRGKRRADVFVSKPSVVAGKADASKTFRFC